MFKRIVSLFLVLVISISSIPAVFADYSNDWSSLGYWEQVLSAMTKISSTTDFGGFVQALAGQLCAGICSMSDDSYHHADTPDRMGSYRKGFGDSPATAIAYCTCKYCGESYEVTVSASDLSAANDTYVNDLPASGISSDGYLYWYPEVTGGLLYFNSVSKGYVWGDYNDSLTCDYTVDVQRSGSNYIISGRASSSSFYNTSFRVDLKVSDSYPVDGFISYRSYVGMSGMVVDSSKVQWAVSISSGDMNRPSACVKGQPFNRSFYSDYSLTYKNIYQFSLVVPAPVVQIEPADSLGNVYNVDSRPTSITGDYGIIGDNGTVTKVDSNTIVNETNNTVYNPVTNTTYDISGWTYDYSSRTYNITTTEDNSVTVTYGDEYVTINEGDTIYNVYYITQAPSTDPGTDTPATCDHTYTSSTTTAPTCEAPGLETLTCSKCGHSYTNRLPATGHTWTIKQTVATEYDEEGNVIQQGYTIYKCSVCSTEYKDEAGTGPPNNSADNSSGDSLWDKIGNLLGTVGEGILGIIEAVAGKLLDGLISLAEMISEKLVRVVDLVLSFFEQIPRLFTGFLDFLTAAFVFLPEDVVLLLTFGIAAVVFIAIFKAWRK